MNSKIFLYLFLILFAGYLYRSIGLSNESIWWDEFSSVVHMKPLQEYESSPDFTRWAQGVHYEPSVNILHFLIKNRSMDPATMPLYYSIEYLWHTYIDESYYSLRLLSVFIGLTVIYSTYILGNISFNASAGLMACLLVSLSPIHRQFSQEIRMYSLFTLLSILSMLLFIHWYQQQRRKTFIGYLIITFLLLWTHPFAILVIMVQGVYLLVDRLIILAWEYHNDKPDKFVYKNYFKKEVFFLIKWAIPLFFISLPSTLYILTINFWSPDMTSSWMKIPTLREFTGDLIADDCIGWTYQLRAEPDFWMNFFSKETAHTLVSQRYFIGGVMAVLYIICFIWAIWGYFLKSKNDKVSQSNNNGETSHSLILLYCIWWLFPPLFLYFVSHLWRPCIMPRYTLHSSIALYLIIGYTLSNIEHKKWMKRLLFTTFLLLYLYQGSLILGKPQHTDWRNAGVFIKHNAKTEDIILVNNELWKRVFLYNLGPVPNVVCYGSQFENTAEIAEFLITKLLPERRPNAKLWIVVQGDYFESAPLNHFEKYLKEKGIIYQAQEFPGIQRVVVYHQIYSLQDSVKTFNKKSVALLEDLCAMALEFWRVKDFWSAIDTCKHVIEIDPGYAQAYSYLGMSYKEIQEWDLAVDAFTKAVELKPEHYPWNWINIADIHINRGQYQLAISALEKAFQLLPNDSFAHTCMGRAYLGLGNREKAIEYFQKALELDPTDLRPATELERLKNNPQQTSPSIK